MQFNSRTAAVRHFAGTFPKGGKIARKAARRAAAEYVKRAVRSSKPPRA